MPVIIPDKLPAKDILKNENIFVMEQSRALRQDIRPQKIVILNIMPLKIATETHILRLLTNSPLQVEIDFLHLKGHDSKNTSHDHLEFFYKTFDQVKNNKYDGMIITGAPVEHLAFEDVGYWSEIIEILNWCDQHVTSTLFICWAAQAALYHYYEIPKIALKEKMFGSFYHVINNQNSPIVRGFDDGFFAPHSRHTETRKEDIVKKTDLELVSESPEAGVYLVVSSDMKRVFVTGHSEYEPDTLKCEYERDLAKGLNTQMPKNYFPFNNSALPPQVTWRSHGNLLYQNWLNYYVYQITPFELTEI